MRRCRQRWATAGEDESTRGAASAGGEREDQPTPTAHAPSAAAAKEIRARGGSWGRKIDGILNEKCRFHRYGKAVRRCADSVIPSRVCAVLVAGTRHVGLQANLNSCGQRPECREPRLRARIRVCIMFRFNVIIPHGCAAIMSAVHTFTYDIIKVLTDRTHYLDLNISQNSAWKNPNPGAQHLYNAYRI